MVREYMEVAQKDPNLAVPLALLTGIGLCRWADIVI